MLMNVGDKPLPSKNRLLSTVACSATDKPDYALEGSVFIGGAAVQWLRDGLGIIESSAEIEELAASVSDSDGVYMVPAFAGLGAPHWDSYARGTIIGITRGTNRGHIARAALEGIAFQVADVLDAMQQDAGSPIEELRVDGGAAANDLLMQFQADIMQVPVVRPKVIETTALGAAFLAGLAVGYWSDVTEIQKVWQTDKVFKPSMSADEVSTRRARWTEALNRAKEWEQQRMTSRGLSREESIEKIRHRTDPWDIVIIGGGATGIGVALDAASRGFRTVLVEQSDFGKGTSSRSTKLVHGGVRYLEQGNITLVRDALRERTLLRNNAPHLVHDMPFLIPCRSWWQRFYYGLGLKVYDFLAVRNSFGRSHGVSLGTAVETIPTLEPDGLRGGVIYHDGQFDDTRLLLNMARTARDHGACLVNYMEATSLLKDDRGRVCGVVAKDGESIEEFDIRGHCVVNAGGPFCDSVRALDDPNSESMIAPSQGVHIVLPKSFFPGDTAMIVPKTSDGRVIFLIPWYDHVIVGTTDTAIPESTLEPLPQDEEIQFLLKTTGDYLSKTPSIDDVLSVFTGIRPLVKGDKSARTASLSRDHVIRIADSGLVTITGGKWTTVRKMAEDCVDRACKSAGLSREPCATKNLRLHGFTDTRSDDPRAYYGADLTEIKALEMEFPSLAKPLDPSLSICGSDVVWATSQEMARTVEDVLARRTRALFLNSTAAIRIAPQVAKLMAVELDEDDDWIADQMEKLNLVARAYLPPTSAQPNQ